MVKEQNVFQEKCKCSVYSLGNGWGKYSVGKVCTCHWKKNKIISSAAHKVDPEKDA